MSTRRRHSKIGSLPINIRRDVEICLINGVTYKAISERLKSLGHDISLYCVFRYAKPFFERYRQCEGSYIQAEMKSRIAKEPAN
jgi:hypothetical protein